MVNFYAFLGISFVLLTVADVLQVQRRWVGSYLDDPSALPDPENAVGWGATRMADLLAVKVGAGCFVVARLPDG